MKNNLVYILTVVTLVIIINYIHIHADPYPECDSPDTAPFFSASLEQMPFSLQPLTAMPEQQCKDCPQKDVS